MTDSVPERANWRTLDAEATPGPWIRERWNNVVHRWRNALDQDCSQFVAGGTADAAFIAAARTGWPAAEQECERLRAEVAAMRPVVVAAVRHMSPDHNADSPVVLSNAVRAYRASKAET